MRATAPPAPPDLQKVRRQLSQKEERLRLILESAVEYAIFTVDRQGMVTSWNTGAQRMLGYTEEEILHHDSRIIFTQEDRDRQAPETEISTALAKGRAINERWHMRKDGSRYWGSGLMMPLRSGGTAPGLLKIMRDETDRRRADKQKQLLIDELNHRVKNTLAIVQAMAEQTVKTTSSLDAFSQSFRGRIIALATAHDLLTRQAWEMVSLEDTVAVALRTWLDEGRIQAGGSEVLLGAKQAIAISMALHELATNATKYGALSNANGSVSIRWEGQGKDCRLHWQERGGPPVTPPARQGFGSRMLMRSLSLELGNPVSLEFETAGVSCQIRFEVLPHSTPPLDYRNRHD